MLKLSLDPYRLCDLSFTQFDNCLLILVNSHVYSGRLQICIGPLITQATEVQWMVLLETTYLCLQGWCQALRRLTYPLLFLLFGSDFLHGQQGCMDLTVEFLVLLVVIKHRLRLYRHISG